jgi:glucose dehydrogenase
MKRSYILMVLAVLTVLIVLGVVAYKMKKRSKTVTFDKIPVMVNTNAAPIPEEIVIPEEEEEEVGMSNAVFLTPNHTIGQNTRDGRIKNIDIRGSPSVTITENKPIWNLSPNTLPLL